MGALTAVRAKAGPGPRRKRPLAVALFAALLAGGVGAEPPSVDGAGADAERVLSAFRDGGADAAAAVEASQGVSEWLVLDALLGADAAAAAAWVAHRRGPDASALQRYAATRGEAGAQDDVRDVVRDAVGFLRRSKPMTAGSLVRPLAVEHDTVLSVARSEILVEVLETVREGGWQHAAAIEALEGAAAAARIGWTTEAQPLYRRAADHAMQTFDYPRWRAAVEGLIAIALPHGTSRPLAHLLNEAGVAATQQGDLAGAAMRYEQAAQAFAGLEDGFNTVVVRQNLGLTLGMLGAFARALETEEDAARRLETERGKPGSGRSDVQWGVLRAQAALNLGILRGELGDYEQAVRWFREAIAGLPPDGDPDLDAYARTNLGLALSELGSYREAERVIEQGLDTFESRRDWPRAAVALADLAWVSAKAGELPKAVARQMGAAERMKEEWDVLLRLSVRGNLGTLRRLEGSPQLAVSIHQEVLAEAERIGARPLVVEHWAGLAQAYVDLGRFREGLDAATKALDGTAGIVAGLGDQTGIAARHAMADSFDAGARAAFALNDAGELFRFLEAGRGAGLHLAMGGREQLWATALSPALAAEEQRARALEEEADAAWTSSVAADDRDAAKAARETRDAARVRTLEVVDRIQREERNGANLVYPRPAELAEVQQGLAPGDALVLYGLLSDDAVALVVRHDDARAVRLGKAKAVRELCEGLLTDDGQLREGASLEEARKALVDGLALPADATRVLVSPDGPIAYMPFAALLADRTVAYVPSGTVLDLLRRDEPVRGQKVLGFGGVLYDGIPDAVVDVMRRGRRLRDLPQTGPEVRRIADLAVVGAATTEEQLRNALADAAEAPGGRWRALHLASHGLVDRSEPMHSSIALTPSGADDGFLTALEIVRMRVPADLVVLSACQSGLGAYRKGEGIVGLTRAFMFAGAPRVVASLWKVDDDATFALMTTFYERLRAGRPTADALRDAQAAVRADPRWKEPRYWAAWVLWGVPS